MSELKDDDELLGSEAAMFFGRVLRSSWQPIRLPQRFGIREIASFFHKGDSKWVVDRFGGLFSTEGIHGDRVFDAFILSASWAVVQEGKPRSVRVHDWLHDHGGPRLFREESSLWYDAIRREFLSWKREAIKAFLDRENASLITRQAEIEAETEQNSCSISDIYHQGGVPEGESPHWPEDDSRRRLLEELHAQHSQLHEEWMAVFKHAERRERALDRQFAELEREPLNFNLVSDWIRWRGYHLSSRDIAQRLFKDS
jgi:hypothetical protein